MVTGKKILKNRAFLYCTEFFAGMSVMAVELGASRLLAPYFSSSQIVWTIIIGTIMIAMALGNIYGGRKADKDPDPDKLYSRILIAALWIGLIPVAGKYIILGIAGALIFTINSNFLIVAAFAACMVVFVFPLFLLGTVTPSLAKYCLMQSEAEESSSGSENPEAGKESSGEGFRKAEGAFSADGTKDAGRTVGNLNAFNTIGSIIGTFVPTFISIPAVGTAITFLIFAGVLLCIAIIYFISEGRGKGKMAAGALIFLLCCIFGHDSSFAFWQDHLSYEGESVYNYLQVYEDDAQVILSTNVLFGVQSVYRKEKGLTGMYYDYAMAAPYMTGVREKEGLDVLILGMGTGTFATQCSRYFGNMNVTGVEIDDKITDLAREYFALPESVPVVTYDGRAYLNASKEQYDLIMVDAYQDITIPFQMSSVEFFTLVKEHLKEDGVMVVNMNMRSAREGNITEYLSDTIASVFPEVYTVNVMGSTNRELFAGKQEGLRQRLRENMAGEEDPDLEWMMETVYANLEPYEAGELIMTDDKAPVELLGMQVIDDLIAGEVAYYKEIYKKEGLQGLLSIL